MSVVVYFRVYYFELLVSLMFFVFGDLRGVYLQKLYEEFEELRDNFIEVIEIKSSRVYFRYFGYRFMFKVQYI